MPLVDAGAESSSPLKAKVDTESTKNQVRISREKKCGEKLGILVEFFRLRPKI